MYDERVFRPNETPEEVARRRDRVATKPRPADEANEKSQTAAETDAAAEEVTPETEKATQPTADDADLPQD